MIGKAMVSVGEFFRFPKENPANNQVVAKSKRFVCLETKAFIADECIEELLHSRKLADLHEKAKGTELDSAPRAALQAYCGDASANLRGWPSGEGAPDPAQWISPFAKQTWMNADDKMSLALPPEDARIIYMSQFSGKIKKREFSEEAKYLTNILNMQHGFEWHQNCQDSRELSMLKYAFGGEGVGVKNWSFETAMVEGIDLKIRSENWPPASLKPKPLSGDQENGGRDERPLWTVHLSPAIAREVMQMESGLTFRPLSPVGQLIHDHPEIVVSDGGAKKGHEMDYLRSAGASDRSFVKVMVDPTKLILAVDGSDPAKFRNLFVGATEQTLVAKAIRDHEVRKAAELNLARVDSGRDVGGSRVSGVER